MCEKERCPEGRLWEGACTASRLSWRPWQVNRGITQHPEQRVWTGTGRPSRAALLTGPPAVQGSRLQLHGGLRALFREHQGPGPASVRTASPRRG